MLFSNKYGIILVNASLLMVMIFISQNSGTDYYSLIDVDASRLATGNDVRPNLLPPPVQLSPGRNKYVVAKFRDPVTKNTNEETQKLRWFVQSAALPYHAEVAFDLVEWICAVPGYEEVRVEVTGGGRIDYDPASSTVSVYGFSHRYGKGDHARVAKLIEDLFGTDVTVTYDLSDKLY